MTIFEKSLASLDALLDKITNDELIGIYHSVSEKQYEGLSVEYYFNLSNNTDFILDNTDEIPYMFESPHNFYNNYSKKRPRNNRGLFFYRNIAT